MNNKPVRLHYKEQGMRGLRCGSKEYKHWTQNPDNVTCKSCLRLMEMDKEIAAVIQKFAKKELARLCRR